MTGREFLNLSAQEVKSWIEKHGLKCTLTNVISENQASRRKIIKKPIVKLRRYGTNDLEHWRITVGYVPYRFTEVVGTILGNKDIMVEEVLRYKDKTVIDHYELEL